MKTFYMTREADESGVSGTGKVLEGVVFQDGQTVIRWCVDGKPNSTAIYPTFEDFEFIHVTSHPTNGTKFFWNDKNSWIKQVSKEIDEKRKYCPSCHNNPEEFAGDICYEEYNQALEDAQTISSLQEV
jgi:hypothetical protein